LVALAIQSSVLPFKLLAKSFGGGVSAAAATPSPLPLAPRQEAHLSSYACLLASSAHTFEKTIPDSMTHAATSFTEFRRILFSIAYSIVLAQHRAVLKRKPDQQANE
jgi:hypothetical protein